MKAVTEKDVKKIAALARLGLTDQEVSRAALDLTQVLSHFALIQDIKTDSVSLASDVSGLSNVTREDEVATTELCSTDSLLSAVPESHGRYVVVTSVF